MKISSILKEDRFSLSFEVFPPKTSDGYETVRVATEEIAALKPSFMSVTYGAGGGTSAHTLAIAKNIMESRGVPSIAHLTCVSSSKETVLKRIKEIKASGIENIMALRGDIPAGADPASSPFQDFRHATELICEIKREAPELCIGAACYPEVHPESRNQREDLQHLKEKAEAGADFFTTQMFFDNNLFYNFLFKLRDSGVFLPVLPGIMPITKAIQVERALSLSGCFMPQRFKSLVDRFGDRPEAMKQAGIAYATDQILDLFANGICHVHVYTMNKPDVAAAIMNNLSAILGTKKNDGTDAV